MKQVAHAREDARQERWPAGADPNLHYLDGRDLYGEADFAEMPLPDQLHPDAATPPTARGGPALPASEQSSGAAIGVAERH